MSDLDTQAANELRKIWDKKRKELQLTQEKAASELNITQSAFSQYLRGILPIKEGFLLRVSRYLGVDPREIRSEFQYTTQPAYDLPSDALNLAKEFAALDDGAKSVVVATVNALKGLQNKHVTH